MPHRQEAFIPRYRKLGMKKQYVSTHLLTRVSDRPCSSSHLFRHFHLRRNYVAPLTSIFFATSYLYLCLTPARRAGRALCRFHGNVPAEHAGWSSRVTEDGRTYYVNKTDKTTSWDLPLAPAHGSNDTNEEGAFVLL